MKSQSRKARWAGVLAGATFLLVVTSPAAVAGTPLSQSASAGSSLSTAHVTQAEVRNFHNSLTLRQPGALSIFGMANGGNGPATGFARGGIVTAVDKAGFVAAALAATEASSDHYTTSELHFSIGGVGISGFGFYGEKSKVLTPPIQPASELTETLVLPESAFVIIVALSGGQNTIVLQGIPGLVIGANGTGPGWSGVLIGHARLAAGTYTVIEKTTNHDLGSPDRADVVGIFAFAHSAAGFIDKVLPIRVVTTVQVHRSPDGAAYDSGKGKIFVANGVPPNSKVSVISDATNKLVANVPVGGFPRWSGLRPREGGDLCHKPRLFPPDFRRRERDPCHWDTILATGLLEPVP